MEMGVVEVASKSTVTRRRALDHNTAKQTILLQFKSAGF